MALPRTPWAPGETSRQEAEPVLRDGVQSRLSACDVWLSMAETLLVGFDSANSSVPAGMAADQILAALALLNKVRTELVETLRESEMQRAGQRVSPFRVHRGLRPALEELAAALERERALAVGPGSGAAPGVEWAFSDGFLRWDGSGGQDGRTPVRLAAYRFIEIALRTVQAAAGVYCDTRPRSSADRSSGEGAPLDVRIGLDAGDGGLDIGLRVVWQRMGSVPDEMGDELFAFISESLRSCCSEDAGCTFTAESLGPDGFAVRVRLSAPLRRPERNGFGEETLRPLV